MTDHELIRLVVENKGNTYPVPKLPPLDPADFYDVYDAESLARVLAALQAEPPLCRCLQYVGDNDACPVHGAILDDPDSVDAPYHS